MPGMFFFLSWQDDDRASYDSHIHLVPDRRLMCVDCVLPYIAAGRSNRDPRLDLKNDVFPYVYPPFLVLIIMSTPVNSVVG